MVSDLFAFAYPAYMSFKAIDSPDPTDDTQWLTYWVVFALCSITESIVGFMIELIPFYYMIKIGYVSTFTNGEHVCLTFIRFFLWLYHPKFCGAGLIL